MKAKGSALDKGVCYIIDIWHRVKITFTLFVHTTYHVLMYTCNLCILYDKLSRGSP